MLDDADWKIFIPLASAFSGALIGAFASQFFAARNRETEDLLKEVRAANAACTMAYSMTDSFITIKRDITKPLLDNFTAEKERYEIAGRNFIPGVSAPVDIKFDLGTFKLTRTPSRRPEIAKSLIFQFFGYPMSHGLGHFLRQNRPIVARCSLLESAAP